MTDPLTVEAPELIGIGAQSLVARAQALGLTWDLRPVTVVAPTESSLTAPISATYDGDISVLPFINVTGFPLHVGQRAMGLTVPPAGNFIIGALEQVTPWTPLVFQNGWHNNGTSVTCSYRRIVAINSVQLVGEIIAGTVAPGTIIGNLPVDFRPLNNISFPIASNPSPAAGAIGPLIQLLPSGNLIIFGIPAGGAAYFSVICPLDAA